MTSRRIRLNTFPPQKQRPYAKLFKTFGDVTGVGALANAGLEGEQATVDLLVRKARSHGVSEAAIARGLALKKKHDQAAALAGIVFPWIPNPVLLRLLAGKPIDDLVTSKRRTRSRP